MQPLNTGLIGAGVFGGYHASKIAASALTSFIGVHDASAERAAALAEKHDTRAFSDAASLFDACDAVMIATPAIYHESGVKAALEAGCHVMVEKPLALSAEGADALVALAAEQSLVLQVGHQERFVLEAMGLFDITEPPRTIEAIRAGPPPQGGRAGDVSVIWDLMIHDLDMFACLGGAGARVQAEGRMGANDLLDEARVSLSMPNGASGHIFASRAASARERRMTLTYDSGAITVDFLARTIENSTDYKVVADVSETLPDPLGAADEAFFFAARGEGETPIPGHKAAEAVRLAEAAERDALSKTGERSHA